MPGRSSPQSAVTKEPPTLVTCGLSQHRRYGVSLFPFTACTQPLPGIQKEGGEEQQCPKEQPASSDGMGVSTTGLAMRGPTFVSNISATRHGSWWLEELLLSPFKPTFPSHQALLSPGWG